MSGSLTARVQTASWGGGAENLKRRARYRGENAEPTEKVPTGGKSLSSESHACSVGQALRIPTLV